MRVTVEQFEATLTAERHRPFHEGPFLFEPNRLVVFDNGITIIRTTMQNLTKLKIDFIKILSDENYGISLRKFLKKRSRR